MSEANPDRSRKRDTGAGRPTLVFTRTGPKNKGDRAAGAKVRT